MGGKTRNVAIQLVVQQCCKTSCTFFVARFYAPLLISLTCAFSSLLDALYLLWVVFLLIHIVGNCAQNCGWLLLKCSTMIGMQDLMETNPIVELHTFWHFTKEQLPLTDISSNNNLPSALLEFPSSRLVNNTYNP